MLLMVFKMLLTQWSSPEWNLEDQPKGLKITIRTMNIIEMGI